MSNGAMNLRDMDATPSNLSNADHGTRRFAHDPVRVLAQPADDSRAFVPSDYDKPGADRSRHAADHARDRAAFDDHVRSANSRASHEILHPFARRALERNAP